MFRIPKKEFVMKIVFQHYTKSTREIEKKWKKIPFFFIGNVKKKWTDFWTVKAFNFFSPKCFMLEGVHAPIPLVFFVALSRSPPSTLMGAGHFGFKPRILDCSLKTWWGEGWCFRIRFIGCSVAVLLILNLVSVSSSLRSCWDS